MLCMVKGDVPSAHRLSPYTTSLLFFVFLFGDRIGRLLYGHTIAAHLVADTTGRGAFGRGREQIIGNRAEEALDAVPTRRIAVGIELFLTLDVVDVEGVVLVGVAIIDFGVRNAHQFDDLQSRARLLAWIVRGIAFNARVLRKLHSRSPDVQRHVLRRGIGIERFLDFGAVHDFAFRLREPRFRYGSRTNELALRNQVEVAHDFAMAHYLTCAATIGAEFGFRTLAGATDTLTGAAGAFYLAVHAIGTGDGSSFAGRVGIERIGDRHARFANALKDIGHLIANAVENSLSALLEKGLLFGILPISNIAAPATGRAANACASLTIGTDDPAFAATSCTEQTTCTIAGRTGEHFVQPFDTSARLGRFQAGDGRQIVVPDGQQRLRRSNRP